MKHARRSSPYVWPAIIAFLSLTAWLSPGPDDRPASPTAQAPAASGE